MDLNGEKNEISDERLASLYQAGDDDAFAVLYLRYKYMIKSCARCFFLTWGDDDDLFQYGSVGLFKAAKYYRGDRNATFSSYAYTCIRSSIITAIKKANAKKNRPLTSSVSVNSETLEIYVGVSDPEEEIISRESRKELLIKINNVLSDFEVRVLSMYLEGLSYAEIGEELKTSQKSIYNAMQRIKNKIGELLAKRRM